MAASVQQTITLINCLQKPQQPLQQLQQQKQQEQEQEQCSQETSHQGRQHEEEMEQECEQEADGERIRKRTRTTRSRRISSTMTSVQLFLTGLGQQRRNEIQEKSITESVTRSTQHAEAYGTSFGSGSPPFVRRFTGPLSGSIVRWRQEQTTASGTALNWSMINATFQWHKQFRFSYSISWVFLLSSTQTLIEQINNAILQLNDY